MKYLSEYRDPVAAKRFVEAIRERVTRPWTLMEVCGGQTHSIVRYGLDALLPAEVELIHGPGCPVCVTPVAQIDQALEVAGREGVILCSYGDMLRVPGTRGDLRQAKAAGADVRVLYSPLDAVELAAAHPEREVVFFAVGFETTAPAHALAVLQAQARGIRNLTLIVSHVLVPPAMEAILGGEHNRVQGFLAAGHVCTVMGTEEYAPLAARYRVPIVVTGFEPLDLLQGIYLCLRQLEEGRAEVENQYARVVEPRGNRSAQDLVRRVFEVVPRRWRGVGEIPRSGLGLRAEFAAFDACARFGAVESAEPAPSECIAGEVLRGLKKPAECPAFGTRCTPTTPLGAPMVSSEGACAAYYRYRAPQGARP
ncbi:MAG: hydrogenase formation protein HypD [Planctomycetes bacterium]|nr:hydrogenase formation protein HypD [Planctomycetota bacterium]